MQLPRWDMKLKDQELSKVKITTFKYGQSY